MAQTYEFVDVSSTDKPANKINIANKNIKYETSELTDDSNIAG